MIPQSYVDLHVTGVYRSVNLFGSPRMFPGGSFLLNILSFGKGMILARGFSSNIFFMDLREASTGNRGLFYSYVALDHLLDPHESSAM